MILPAPIIALAALIPAMAGPLPSTSKPITLELALCSGGSVTVPIGGNAPPGEGSSPCCAKGCHSGDQRKKRFDRKQ